MGHSDKTDPGLQLPGYVPVQSKKKMSIGIKFVIGWAIILGFFAFIGAITSVRSSSVPSLATLPPKQAAPMPAKPAPPEPPPQVTPRQHLEAISNLAKLATIQDSDISEARKHVDAIPENVPERARGKSLLVKMEQKHAAQMLKMAIATRKAYANRFENNMLDRGLNMTITAIGKDATTLRMEYVLTSKVSMHALGQNDQFWAEVREVGFKKVILTNGFESSLGETWTWKVD